MYVFEIHDDELDDEVQGTLCAHIGRGGAVDYAYQAEICLQEVTEDGMPWRRAYLKTANQIKVVWARDLRTGEVRYLARTPSYDGTWELPFVGEPDARIAVGVWGQDVTDEAGAQQWAAAQLQQAITAVLMDHGEIRSAWEMVDGTPQLVSRTPQTTPPMPRGRW